MSSFWYWFKKKNVAQDRQSINKDEIQHVRKQISSTMVGGGMIIKQMSL